MMFDHSPLTSHERLKAQALLRRIVDARFDIALHTRGPDAVPKWIADNAYDRLFDAALELERWLNQDNAVGVRGCLQSPPTLPPRRS